MKIIQGQIDFTNYTHPIRQSEVWLPFLKMKNSFSDTGYRFRENKFYMNDEWIPFYPSQEIVTHDITLYNSDTVSTSTDNKYIAMLWFRLDEDIISHTRIVYHFMDWLSSIGGTLKALMNLYVFILGGYLAFNSSIETMSSLYYTENNGK